MINILLSILALFSVVDGHSGVHLVNTSKSSSDFSASFLLAKNRFMAAEDNVKVVLGMASTTFNVVRLRCKNCKTLVTYDFFDFMVEHLSSSSNQIPNHDEELFTIASERLQTTAELLKDTQVTPESDQRLSETLGILIYSSICFSKNEQKIQSTIRPYYFHTTFWSVYRYVKNIAIYVATQKDYDTIVGWKLPYTFLTILPDTPRDFKNRTNMLPRDSLLHMIGEMKAEKSEMVNYHYVYYSEGDQILHMREPEVLYNVIDNSGGSFVFVPHRMQTLPVQQDFPGYLHKKWGKGDQAQNIPGVKIVVEDMHKARGSCCSFGDIEMERCGNGWWYQCPDFGIGNLTTWLKFGDSGFTMPPSTEHKYICEYHPERIQCPIPHSCAGRVPRRKHLNLPLTDTDVCEGIVNTIYLGKATTNGDAPTTNKKEKLSAPALKPRKTDKVVKESATESAIDGAEIITDGSTSVESDGPFKKSRKQRLRRRKGKNQLGGPKDGSSRQQSGRGSSASRGKGLSVDDPNDPV